MQMCCDATQWIDGISDSSFRSLFQPFAIGIPVVQWTPSAVVEYERSWWFLLFLHLFVSRTCFCREMESNTNSTHSTKSTHSTNLFRKCPIFPVVVPNQRKKYVRKVWRGQNHSCFLFSLVANIERIITINYSFTLYFINPISKGENRSSGSDSIVYSKPNEEMIRRERQDEGNSGSSQKGFHEMAYCNSPQHCLPNGGIPTKHESASIQEEKPSLNSPGIPNTEDWPLSRLPSTWADSDGAIPNQELPASCCDWPEPSKKTTRESPTTSQDTIRTQDLPNTCEWPSPPPPVMQLANDEPKPEANTLATQELPNTCDWPLLVVRPQHSRNPPSPESGDSILTEDLPDTCHWQQLPIASTMAENKDSPLVADRSATNLPPNQGSANIMFQANPNDNKENEAESVASTIVPHVPVKPPTRQDDDTSTTEISPPLAISKPTRRETNIKSDDSTISTVLMVSSHPASNMHIPKSVPLPRGAPLSLLASPRGSSTDEESSPSPVKRNRKPWFQKKKRRKLKQTTLTFGS